MDNNDDESLNNETNNPLSRRWTCDACGCNTNVVLSDRNCTICGTAITNNNFANNSGRNPSSLRQRAAALVASSNLGSSGSNSNSNSAAGLNAIRAGWLVRSLNHQAGRSAGSSGGANNNNIDNANSAAAQFAGMMDASAIAASADDFSFDDDDLWESVMNGVVEPTNTHSNAPPHPLEMQLSMGFATARSRYLAESNRQQRLLEAASRAFSQNIRGQATSSTILDPDDLLQSAISNAAFYQPNWADPCISVGGGISTASTRSSRSAAAAAALTMNSNSFILFSGEKNQIAHVPLGALEGRAIRTEQPFPQVGGNNVTSNLQTFDPFGLPSTLSPTNSHDSDSFDLLCNPEIASSPQQRRSRIFGFRVVFDIPTASDNDTTQVGSDLGGCFLIGVTSTSFTSFNESSALQRSNLFWGIEDQGQIFEGSTRNDVRGNNTSARPSQQQRDASRRRIYTRLLDGSDEGSNNHSSAGASSFSMELGIDDSSTNVRETHAIPMNAHSVLFGLREVITVVCDLEHRSLTYWRNETLLGTLVCNLPRGGNLFPIVVPFNAGVTVAISAITVDPLPMLQTYATRWREKQEDTNQKIRSKLAKERAVLIKDGMPSLKLQKVLRQIFAWYTDFDYEAASNDIETDNLSISQIMASRLWYRCGMKLSALDEILSSSTNKTVNFQDFFELVTNIVAEDDSNFNHNSLNTVPTLNFEIGDKVELVEGFERFDDASSGPLQVGDRGVVVDVQRGPTCEKQSVRVLHSGRRWWYHAQAIVSEKSGLIESSGIWFLKGVLRSHGFDHGTLTTIVARPVTSTSWRIGDIVTHKSTINQISSKKVCPESPACSSMIGRIVTEPSANSSVATLGRQNNSVAVEFVNRAFADVVGIKPSSLPALSHEIRRVKTHKLVHTTEIHGSRLRIQACRNDTDNQDESSDNFDPTVLLSSAVNEKVILDIEAMRRLDRHAIDSLAKQCRKGSDVLASMFSSGLPDAIMDAISAVDIQMNSVEPQDDLPDNIVALSNLVNELTERLFGNTLQEQETDDMEAELSSEQKSMPWQNTPRNMQNREQLRSSTKHVVQGEQSRSGERSDQIFSSSLQQRQNMLLSFMSRASHTDNNSASAEAMNEPFGQIAPSLIQVRSASPFILGASNDLLGYEEQVRTFTERQGEFLDPFSFEDEQKVLPSHDVDGPAIGRNDLLDSVLRCHGSISAVPYSSGSTKQGGAAFALFVRHLIRCGILFDCDQWVEALILGYYKNFQAGAQAKASTMLRGVVDEEGTSILALSIALGCSVEVIGQLIKYGAPVGSDAIIKAAMTNQPRILSLLLQHTSYEEGIINLQSCSPAISRLLILAKTRQDQLSKRMEDEAGAFMVRLLCKLFEVGLASRRIRRIQSDKVGKIICEMLIGNVLLRSLQMNQKAAPCISQGEAGKKHDASVQIITKECGSEIYHSSQGVLGALPQAFFNDYLFCEVGNVTKFLSLCEDYLCSKDMTDVANGLTFLSITLGKHPQLKISSEIERFGISEFVSNHNVLSSNRIADILSKELNIGLDVSKKSTVLKDEIDTSPFPGSSEIGTVLCPKKHTASLHITRHSSFRCDICGAAVPKGEYIFGCRQCDYDECLHCTLRDEKRILGVHIMIRELASECNRVLFDIDTESSFEQLTTNEELKALSLRLLQQDVLAMNDLAVQLNIPGRITIHEFLTIILPSLHASLVSHAMKNEGEMSHSGTVHRSKKARASRSSSYVSLPDHVKYCREALRHMVSNRDDISSDILTKKQLPERTKFWDDVDFGENDGEKLDISSSTGASEILRRLHQILSFYENVQLFKTSTENSGGSNSHGNGNHDDMHDLAKPLELLLSHSSNDVSGSNHFKTQSVIYAEPLISFSDLQLHVLRAYRIIDPNYTSYCHLLAADKAIIIERPKLKSSSLWRIGRVECYDENTGGHVVRYASGWKRGKERHIISLESSCEDFSYLTFDSESSLVLAAREYYVIFRKQSHTTIKRAPTLEMQRGQDSITSDSSRLVQAIGSRVESSCGHGSTWSVLTLAGVDTVASKEAIDGMRFILISDEGEVFAGVPSEQIRARGSLVREESSRQGRSGRPPSDDRSSLFPFLAIRERIEFARYNGERMSSMSDVHNQTKALKRTWSALSLMDEMRPVDLNVPSEPTCNKLESNDQLNECITLKCQLDESTLQFVAKSSILELPPSIFVFFSAHENLPTLELKNSQDTTLIGALQELHQRQRKWSEWPPKPTCRLFFSIKVTLSDFPKKNIPESYLLSDMLVTVNRGELSDTITDQVNRSRKLSACISSKDEELDTKIVTSLCDGVDEICVQCMEVIGVISECANDPMYSSDKDSSISPGFSSFSLSMKLTTQLNQTMCCVGAALPGWCLAAPAFAPHIFTYESRRMLLQRTAFGPSRSALCQQEAKINVGKLRQRMASLRARAVELVGEAFAGGAEDPTALQLQADELYGMEEALASRVKAAFRAAKWQERGLQVAKAAVRRDRLLSDASAVMDRYTNDSTVCRRRLEVRFEGESGFDAASGNEAGVTRGFYADIAEALLSVDTVAGVCCTVQCSPVAATDTSMVDHADYIHEVDDEAWKLPLWIPDMDNSLQMILPTPRAAKGSLLGVFPRPIPQYHPQFNSVIRMFRFMGRLFASALRDGFMFPVPLSAAFLKLVQHGSTTRRDIENSHAPLLTSDLPRPGFLGGEVFAADYYVCRALDRLDMMDPPLSRHELKRAYEEVATDPNFARVAFGKSYDCSFEEYYQDRTFVDPIDPAQDANAAPLCPKGHTKSITVYNVREWVTLAKNFMLYEGVIEQANAFRRGVDDFFSSDYLRVFTSDELQRDVCGVGDDVDNWNEASIRKLFKLDGGNGATEALVAVAAIGGEGGATMSRRFGPSSPTITFLIKSLLEASSTQRRQFLNFVTSVPIASMKMGMIEVVPILSPSGEFIPMHDPSCLPRANTCSRRLYLPRFESYESFSEVLWAVVREESKFKGFYEWRGN